MDIPYLSVVRMASNRYRHEGIEPGAIGVVVDVYGDGEFEVEFSDQEGITIALLTLRRHDVELVAESVPLSAQRSAG